MSTATRHIALVCPGGPVSRELAEKTADIAAARFGARARLHFHPQCFAVAGHFAGDDAVRAAAFLDVANDPAYEAVWFARGGYGACRLDDALFARLNDHARAKTYLGYSDNGALLARLYREGIGRPVHGPIPTDLAREGGEEAITRALAFLVDGDMSGVEPSVRGDGRYAAFNITVLAAIAGSPWAPDLAGHVVMLEDVGEYLYRIDRSMFAIMANAGMRKAAGLKLGRVSAIPENDRPFGSDEEEIARYWCRRTGVPYLGRADIGHDAANKIVPFGPFPMA